jgi:hypothetical protein
MACGKGVTWETVIPWPAGKMSYQGNDDLRKVTLEILIPWPTSKMSYLRNGKPIVCWKGSFLGNGDPMNCW